MCACDDKKYFYPCGTEKLIFDYEDEKNILELKYILSPEFIDSYEIKTAYKHDAGFDLKADLPETISLRQGEYALIPTGLKIAIPVGYEGQVRPRSGLAAKHGISVVNSPGTIDSEYRGEVKVILINHGSKTIVISPEDKIAQLVICPIPKVNFKKVTQLPPSSRGEKGFGSSGV